MNYWLWLEDRQTRVREATAVSASPSAPSRRPRRRLRLPRLLAVRAVPPGRSDAMQSPLLSRSGEEATLSGAAAACEPALR